MRSPSSTPSARPHGKREPGRGGASSRPARPASGRQGGRDIPAGAGEPPRRAVGGAEIGHGPRIRRGDQHRRRAESPQSVGGPRRAQGDLQLDGRGPLGGGRRRPRGRGTPGAPTVPLWDKQARVRAIPGHVQANVRDRLHGAALRQHLRRAAGLPRRGRTRDRGVRQPDARRRTSHHRWDGRPGPRHASCRRRGHRKPGRPGARFGRHIPRQHRHPRDDQRPVPEARAADGLHARAALRTIAQGRRVPHRPRQRTGTRAPGLGASRDSRRRPQSHGRLLPRAGSRTQDRLMQAVVFLHGLGARALLAFAVVLAVWGTYGYFRHAQVSGGFRSSYLVMAGLTAVQGLLDRTAFAFGGRPTELLPLVYVGFRVTFRPASYLYAHGGSRRREAVILAGPAWVVSIAYFRGIATG